MIKKTLSVLLALMMIVSVLTVGFVTANAATTAGFTPESTKFYFDVEGTGWTMGTKNKVAFHIFGGDFDTEANTYKPKAWGAKAEIGAATAGETGVFEFDPGAKLKCTFTPGVQYKIIFVRTDGQNWTDQTYDLFFTTDCLGHVAYSSGKMFENPVDSSKKALATYWRDMDASAYGPVKAISSIGNVVGECPENGKTDYDILKDFFTEEKTDFKGNTGYQNAHKYVCEISETAASYKTEQKMIDDIAADLDLTKDDVKSILEDTEVQAKFTETELGCAWSYDASPLPAGQAVHTHTPGEPVIENDHASTCTVQGSYDEVIYCTECKEEISRETKYHDLAQHTPGEPVIENDHASTCTVQGAYDEVTYCTVCKGEISRDTKYHDLAPHTPGEPVITNVVDPGCETAGSHDEIVTCTVCKQQLDDLCKFNVEDLATGHEDPLTFVPEVPATASVDGVAAHYTCTKCHKLFLDAAGAQETTAEALVIKADHVRGDANSDGKFDTTDVTALQRHLIEYVVNPFDAIAADANLDEELDVIDVTLMQRVLAKMTTWEKWDEKHPRNIPS